LNWPSTSAHSAVCCCCWCCSFCVFSALPHLQLLEREVQQQRRSRREGKWMAVTRWWMLRWRMLMRIMWQLSGCHIFLVSQMAILLSKLCEYIAECVCVITAFTEMHTLTSYFCQFGFGNRQQATGYRPQPRNTVNSKPQTPNTGRPRDLKSHLCLLPKWCNKKSECCPQVAPGRFDPRCDAMLSNAMHIDAI